MNKELQSELSTGEKLKTYGTQVKNQLQTGR